MRPALHVSISANFARVKAKFIPIIFFIGVLISSNHCSQAQTVHEFSGWFAFFGSYKINDKFGIHFESQLRSSDQWEQLRNYIIRVGVNYQVKKNMVATLGYAYIGHHRTIMGVSGWGPEHRIWEQFILNKSYSIAGHATSLQHRFRLEQRFISTSVVDGDKLKTENFQFMQRLRYFARSIFPLQPTTSFTNGVYVSLQDEIFLNIQNASVTTGKFFDQNRAYFSLGYRVSRKFDFEFGYMNQFIVGRNNNVVNNILQLATYLRL